MKLNNRKNKTIKVLVVIGIILLAIAVVIGIALAIYKLVDNTRGKEISYIDFSVYPTKRSYYVGESLDPTGVRIQVVYKNGNVKYINNVSKLEFSGFDSSEACEKQWITITYEGASVQYDIDIIELPKPTPTLESIEVYKFKDEYTLDRWNVYGPSNSGASIRCIYSDGSVVDDIPLQYEYIYHVEELSNPGITYIIVKYSDGVTTVETTVTITITE